jgi:hypothetical protein
MLKKLFYLFFLFVLTGCSHDVTKAKNYKEKVNSHKTIAILPFKMTLNLTKGQQKIISEQEKARLAQSLSVDLQRKLYFSLLKHVNKKELAVDIQQVDETLDKLSANSVRFNDLDNPDKRALLKILGVDAIFEARMSITQEGVALTAVSPIVIIETPNLFIDLSVSIKDHSTDSAFWNYKKSEHYMAANKINKNKKTASDDFLAPLFLNIDDIFKRFITKQPYLKK